MWYDCHWCDAIACKRSGPWSSIHMPPSCCHLSLHVHACREDTDISDKAIESLKKAVLGFKADVDVAGTDCVLMFKEVEECSGTATVVFVRGKVRPGFEMKLKAKWCAVEKEHADAEDAAPLASGTLSIDDMTDYETPDDYDVEIEAEEGTDECMVDSREAWDEMLTKWRESLSSH